MEDEEWEDVLAGSYVPLPITWDEHPDFVKFNKILTDLKLEVHEVGGSIPLDPKSRAMAFSWGPNKLAVLFNEQSSEPWIFDRNNNYKHLEKRRFGWASETVIQNKVIDPSGKFLWCWEPGSKENRKLTRFVCKTGELESFDLPVTLCNKTTEYWVSSRYVYAYDASMNLHQLDPKTSNWIDLSSELQKMFANLKKLPGTDRWTHFTLNYYRFETPFFFELENNKVAILCQKDIFQGNGAHVKLGILKEKTGEFVHSVENIIRNQNSYKSTFANHQILVTKEGLFTKERTFLSLGDKSPAFWTTRVYKLSDLGLNLTYKQKALSLYPLEHEKILMTRVGGIPVFFDCLDKLSGKTFAKFSFLYGNRFHPIEFKTPLKVPTMESIQSLMSHKHTVRESEMFLSISFKKRFCLDRHCSGYIFKLFV